MVLLLPGGVLVEDHRVSHDDQQGPGSGQGHVESLQGGYTHTYKTIKEEEIHLLKDPAGSIITIQQRQTFSFDRNPRLKSLSILT